jgi:hypothetical protein
MKNTETFAVRYAQLTTRVGFFTGGELADLFGTDVAELVANPAGVEGITATAADLTEDNRTHRTHVETMVPSIIEVGSALAAGWPAMAVDADVLTAFLAETYELAADWQATAEQVADLFEVVTLDKDLLAESGLSFSDDWAVDASLQQGKKAVTFTVKGRDLPVQVNITTEQLLAASDSGTGVDAAIAALQLVAIEVNKLAAREVYTRSDAEQVTAATGRAAGGETIGLDHLAQILNRESGLLMNEENIDGLLDVIRAELNA